MALTLNSARQSPARLRPFVASHIDENCESLSGTHDNELFFGCQFKKLNGLTLKNCVLNGSKFTTDTVGDALGFTLTLDCHSFIGAEYSPLLFDLFLLLALQSKGNVEKRKQLLAVIGKDRVFELLHAIQNLE